MPECFIYAALFDIVFAHIVCRKVIVGLYVVYEHSLAAFLCFQKRKFGTVFLESHTQSGNYRFQFAVAFDCCLEGDFCRVPKTETVGEIYGDSLFYPETCGELVAVAVVKPVVCAFYHESCAGFVGLFFAECEQRVNVFQAVASCFQVHAYVYVCYAHVGECVVVGDAIMLPSKIILDKPKEKPKSATIDFWDRWYDGKQTVFDIDAATLNLIKQSRG